MSKRQSLSALDKQIIACRLCPRLIEHCRRTGSDKRASFRHENYWAKPVANFGDPAARILVVGLAPAAHGANRTGRMFTGDRSGDFLYRTLHCAALANQPTATSAKDGLQLHHLLITAACHCAPPANKPTSEELDNCMTWLEQTFDLLPGAKVVVCLGKIAMDRVLKLYRQRGHIDKLSPYKFGHGAEYDIQGAPTLLCAYHPSQQNTFTGRLTEPMLLGVFQRAKEIAGIS